MSPRDDTVEAVVLIAIRNAQDAVRMLPPSRHQRQLDTALSVAFHTARQGASAEALATYTSLVEDVEVQRYDASDEDP
jgi:hypothetical protein